jgi:excisionase family DNA binding protein
VEEGPRHAKEFYTARELAERFAITETTVYRLAARGELPYYSIGRSKRFRRDDIEEWLEGRRSVLTD